MPAVSPMLRLTLLPRTTGSGKRAALLITKRGFPSASTTLIRSTLTTSNFLVPEEFAANRARGNHRISTSAHTPITSSNNSAWVRRESFESTALTTRSRLYRGVRSEYEIFHSLSTIPSRLDLSGAFHDDSHPVSLNHRDRRLRSNEFAFGDNIDEVIGETRLAAWSQDGDCGALHSRRQRE